MLLHAGFDMQGLFCAVQDGDPYRDEMEQCVGLIMEQLAQRGVRNRFSLAYQSRVGPVHAWPTLAPLLSHSRLIYIEELTCL